jgi:hypothetical protein
VLVPQARGGRELRPELHVAIADDGVHALSSLARMPRKSPSALHTWPDL